MTKFPLMLAFAGALAAGGGAAAQESDPLRKLAPVEERTAFPEMTTGQAVYRGVCQGCHMPDAKGAVGAGAYPALADNERLATAEYPLMVVLGGQKAMPAFGGLMSDAQIAGVITYLRTNFGNRFRPDVAAADVARMRQQ